MPHSTLTHTFVSMSVGSPLNRRALSSRFWQVSRPAPFRRRAPHIPRQVGQRVVTVHKRLQPAQPAAVARERDDCLDVEPAP